MFLYLVIFPEQLQDLREDREGPQWGSPLQPDQNHYEDHFPRPEEWTPGQHPRKDDYIRFRSCSHHLNLLKHSQSIDKFVVLVLLDLLIYKCPAQVVKYLHINHPSLIFVITDLFRL